MTTARSAGGRSSSDVQERRSEVGVRSRNGKHDENQFDGGVKNTNV